MYLLKFEYFYEYLFCLLSESQSLGLFWLRDSFVEVYRAILNSHNKFMIEKQFEEEETEFRPQTKGSTATTFHQTRRPHRRYTSVNKNRNTHSQKMYSTSQNPQRNRDFRVRSPSPSPERKMLYWQNWLLPIDLRKPNEQKLQEFNSKAVCAMFSDSDQIFVGHQNREVLQIASLTKIMTAFTVVNICSNYGIKIRETWIRIQKEASMMEGTSANLRNGQELLVIDLLYGLMLPSGNDAGVALSQYFGKYLSFHYSNDQKYTDLDDITQKQEKALKFESMRQFYDQEYKNQSIKLFVFEMNKNCHKIGLKNTKFSNPTGLTDDTNVSTAEDICKLVSFCLKNHILRSIFKKKNYICESRNQKLAQTRQIQWKNTNKHLFTIKQCIGVKTGITPGAGPCLSTAYRIMGRQLIVVVLNSRSLEHRYTDCQNIYRYARTFLQSR